MVSGPAISSERERDGILTEMRTVHLPAELCDRAERRFGKEFGNLEQLLDFVLRDLLQDDAARADEGEQRIIEQRLRDLGYL